MRKIFNKQALLTRTVAVVAPLLVAGCSSVPDYANPVEWYRSSVDYFLDDETETTNADEATSKPKENIEEGFVAPQRSKEAYADAVSRQGPVVNALGESKKVDVASNASSQSPAPVASPSQPVQAQTLSVTPQPTQQVIAQPAPSSAPQVADNRSVSEVYADSLSQTRPLAQTSTQLFDVQTPSLGGLSFDTVVVSSNGVTRENQPSFGGQQFAYANTGIQSDFNQPIFGSAAALEASVVSQGQALSLTQFNPAQFRGSFQVATIQFTNGSSELSEEDRRILREVFNIHKQQGGVVRIVGHASSRTQNMTAQQHFTVNQQVSVTRSNTVAKELLNLGVEGNSLYVGGVSDTQPLYQEIMPSGEAGNRRTEIFIDY